MEKLKIVCDNEKCIPIKKHDTDAGYDLIANRGTRAIPAGATLQVKTGVRVAIPKGYAGLVVPRSSLGIKGANLANTVGVIDSDYRGEIIVHMRNTGTKSVVIAEGERFAQLLLIPVALPDLEIVESLDDTVRGEGGFGSTNTSANDNDDAVTFPSNDNISEADTLKEKLKKLKGAKTTDV